MLLTEEEAKTKWCPFSRVEGDNRWKQSLPADEPWALNPVPCRCIGPACMAWQWAEHWEPSEQIHIPGGGSYTTEKPSPSRGYCGLAGRPE